MNAKSAVLTACGGFLFPFVIRMMWGRMVKIGGVAGGFFASVVIVGTIWATNHGIKNHLIQQTGPVWIDMAWAAGIGIFTASVISGGKIGKSIVNIFAAVVGGILGGFILSLNM